MFLNIVKHSKTTLFDKVSVGFDLFCKFSTVLYVLFILYKFVIGFLTISFLSLFISSLNFHDVCQRFLYNQDQISA